MVDNASSDGSPEEIERRFPSVRLIRNDRNGGFPANNLAMGDLDGVALRGPRQQRRLRRARLPRPAGRRPRRRPGPRRRLPQARCSPPASPTSRLEPAAFRPGGGDDRELGVMVRGVTVEGVDVWRHAHLGDGGWGREADGDGTFEWSRPSAARAGARARGRRRPVRRDARAPGPRAGHGHRRRRRRAPRGRGRRRPRRRSRSRVVGSASTTCSTTSAPRSSTTAPAPTGAGSSATRASTTSPPRCSPGAAGACSSGRSTSRDVGPLRRAVLPLLRGHRPLVAGPGPGLALPHRAHVGDPPPARGQQRRGLRGLRLPRRAQPPPHAGEGRAGPPRRHARSWRYLLVTASYARRDLVRPLLGGHRPRPTRRAPPGDLLRRLPAAAPGDARRPPHPAPSPAGPRRRAARPGWSADEHASPSTTPSGRPPAGARSTPAGSPTCSAAVTTSPCSPTSPSTPTGWGSGSPSTSSRTTVEVVDPCLPLERASARFDLLVNVSYRSHGRNGARHGIYVVHFPDRPGGELAAVAAAPPGPRRSGGRHRSRSLDGFHEPDIIRWQQVRWTNGPGVLRSGGRPRAQRACCTSGSGASCPGGESPHDHGHRRRRAGGRRRAGAGIVEGRRSSSRCGSTSPCPAAPAARSSRS